MKEKKRIKKSGAQGSWHFKKGVCGRRWERGWSDSGLARGKATDLVGLCLKGGGIQCFCTVNAWLGSQPVLA